MFEYEMHSMHVLYIDNDAQDLLNRYGLNGWELISVTVNECTYRFWFKRPARKYD